MKDKAFLDTNVLVYLYSISEAAKRTKSISLFRNYSCVTSTQALNEFSNVFLKKYKQSKDTIKKSVEDISKLCEVQFISKQTICTALDFNNSCGYSYYDCLMLASALECNCSILFSEDMNNGHLIENKLTIINPYVI